MIAFKDVIAEVLENELAAMQDKNVAMLLKNDVYTICACIRSERLTHYFPRYGVGTVLYAELKMILDAAGVKIVKGKPEEGHNIVLANGASKGVMTYAREYYGMAV